MHLKLLSGPVFVSVCVQMFGFAYILQIVITILLFYTLCFVQTEFSIRFLAFKYPSSVGGHMYKNTCVILKVTFKTILRHVFLISCCPFFFLLIVCHYFSTTILRIKEVTAFISTVRRSPIILPRTVTLTSQYVCSLPVQ